MPRLARIPRIEVLLTHTTTVKDNCQLHRGAKRRGSCKAQRPVGWRDVEQELVTWLTWLVAAVCEGWQMYPVCRANRKISVKQSGGACGTASNQISHRALRMSATVTVWPAVVMTSAPCLSTAYRLRYCVPLFLVPGTVGDCRCRGFCGGHKGQSRLARRRGEFHVAHESSGWLLNRVVSHCSGGGVCVCTHSTPLLYGASVLGVSPQAQSGLSPSLIGLLNR
ncbi:hypothetical protein B0T24DRAFT_423115 [Lasiosphaeria ovina]|uniref:Uncharacterized protein n=1 Tax=Lasiosphaeria ovina TaxID=92902 RepID=A0AAE0JVI2_9PEZI|nr:hypothetical protein B0T24DRAFT_423115 [Lasiosphaeria ovina]